MIYRILGYFLFSTLFFALLLYVSGVTSMDSDTGFQILVTFKENMTNNPIKIPAIPTIPRLGNVTGLPGGIEILWSIMTSIYNGIRFFLNGIVTVINVFTSFVNFSVGLYVYIYSFIQVLVQSGVTLFTF